MATQSIAVVCSDIRGAALASLIHSRAAGCAGEWINPSVRIPDLIRKWIVDFLKEDSFFLSFKTRGWSETVFDESRYDVIILIGELGEISERALSVLKTQKVKIFCDTEFARARARRADFDLSEFEAEEFRGARVRITRAAKVTLPTRPSSLLRRLFQQMNIPVVVAKKLKDARWRSWSEGLQASL